MIVMTESPSHRTARHRIGRIQGSRPGPSAVFVAGMHGNEPSGVEGVRRVLARMEAEGIDPRGDVIGLAGNLAALEARRRFLAQDLNRLWVRREIDAIRDGAPEDLSVPEDRERRELLTLLHEEFDRARGPVLVLDLHTASSQTAPFIVFGDTLRNRRFARSFGAPMILGLEEELTGTLMEYVTGLGHISMVFEAGQHEDPVAADHQESVVWMALETHGCLEPSQIPDYRVHRARVRSGAEGVPQILEIFKRHAIAPEDRFIMKPGYRNFQRVRRGEVVGQDRTGPITVSDNSLLFLPLYQGLGSDGFFLARSVNPVWLAVSTWLRRFGAANVVARLPGVRPHPKLAATLLVDRRIARFLAPQIFHLLGYRVRTVGASTLEVKRRED
ncbi:MAG: aspartoacylase [Gemmatimonadetes bacterium]|nr:aspartoacylase [Gemmatimonadota bacterium]